MEIRFANGLNLGYKKKGEKVTLGFWIEPLDGLPCYLLIRWWKNIHGGKPRLVFIHVKIGMNAF